jgi:zinc-ribbon domain
MADRFCGECGNELSEDDRFCRNCGTPVHEAAVVPSPEADVSTPPPPPQSGWQRFKEGWQGTGQEGTRFSDPAPPPREEPRPFLYQSCLNFGCAVIIILIVLGVVLVLIGSASGG